MITLEHVYVLMGVLVGGVAVINLLDRANPRSRYNATFWGLYAISFLLGSHLSNVVNGLLVLGMVIVAGSGRIGASADTSAKASRAEQATRWGNRLFIPALIIPVVTLGGTLTLKSFTIGERQVVDPKQVTVISLALATVIALVWGLVMLRARLSEPVREARRIFDAVGWAAVLPQMLATLGAIFAAGGVGGVVATVLGTVIPLGSPLVVVVTYCVGMALFTIIMGNAFAAFPVMTAALGLPLIVHRFGGDPAIMSAVGMLSGFCGTLMTPMAANFNIVPVALLELPDQYAVIRAQLPTALVLLAANTALMYLLVFHH